MFKGFKGILSIPFFVLALSLNAQITTVSPYSRFGVGEYATPDFVRAVGFGGANLGLQDPLNINLNNPASYSALALTTFELGLKAGIIEQRQSNPPITLENYSAGMLHFAIGVPLTKWWGGALALKPYTFRGYNISSQRLLLPDSFTVVDRSEGSGGLNQLTFGNSFVVGKGLSLGFNANFIFGRLEERNSTLFFGNNAPINSRTVYIDNTSGFTFDFGAQYDLEISERRHLGVGITYGNATDLGAMTNRFAYTYRTNELGTETIQDSLIFIDNREASLRLPSQFGVGLSYSVSSPYSFQRAWGLSLDYEQTNGSEFRDVTGRNAFLQDGFRLGLGGFMTPGLSITKLERSNSVWSRIEYRAGAFYQKGLVNLRGSSIDDYGITFGLGIPVSPRSVVPGEIKRSYVNVGLVLGRRGSLENNLIREDYLNFYLGITLNDKWFTKYKYR